MAGTKTSPKEDELSTVCSNDFNNPIYGAVLPFIIGGLSGSIATICLQPIDTIKVRLQLIGEGSRGGGSVNAFTVAQDVVAQGRALELYSGLSAALLRQAVYGTSRLGLFFTFEDALIKRAKNQGKEVPFGERAAAGIAAGGMGAFIGNPTEVALIRMQSDGMRPQELQQNYRCVYDALRRIVHTEGLTGLWTGANATIARAMCTNFGQLAFFSETKSRLEKIPNVPDQARIVAASIVAGFFAAFFSMPLDFVKTRLQRQAAGTLGKAPYAGLSDCFLRILREEGYLRFYRGFGTYFLRMAPHSYVRCCIAFLLAAANLGKESFL